MYSTFEYFRVARDVEISAEQKYIGKTFLDLNIFF